MKGVAPQTEEVLNQISGFECIKEYTLIGGTALSMQIEHRLSEDIDFCRWKRSKNERISVHCTQIEKEFSFFGTIQKDMISDDQVDYMLNGVKVSFYCNNLNKTPEGMKVIHVKENLKIADILSIGVMKLEVMLRRSTFRDYYDIYSVIQAGGDFIAMVNGALRYSGHKLRTRDILSMLSDHNRFDAPKNLDALGPKYHVSAYEIEDFLRPYISNFNKKIISER